MKFSPVFIVFLVLCTAVSGQDRLGNFEARCQNFISISGGTNVNEFELQQEVPESLVCGLGDSKWVPYPEKELYIISIPVRNFSATNKMVYKDFLKLLKVTSYPDIKIFMDEEQFNALYSGSNFYLANIGVIVSGVSRYYRIPCTISPCVDGRITVSGRQELMLTDFKLEPPEKTLGLIKVQNQLIINFEFRLPLNQELNYSKI